MRPHRPASAAVIAAVLLSAACSAGSTKQSASPATSPPTTAGAVPSSTTAGGPASTPSPTPAATPAAPPPPDGPTLKGWLVSADEAGRGLALSATAPPAATAGQSFDPTKYKVSDQNCAYFTAAALDSQPSDFEWAAREYLDSDPRNIVETIAGYADATHAKTAFDQLAQSVAACKGSVTVQGVQGDPHGSTGTLKVTGTVPTKLGEQSLAFVFSQSDSKLTFVPTRVTVVRVGAVVLWVDDSGRAVPADDSTAFVTTALNKIKV